MKIEVTKTEMVEVEVSFPHYRKSADTDCHWYKVLNETESIQVTNTHSSKTIQTCPTAHAYTHNFDVVDCTKEEFDAVYFKTIDLLIAKTQTNESNL